MLGLLSFVLAFGIILTIAVFRITESDPSNGSARSRVTPPLQPSLLRPRNARPSNDNNDGNGTTGAPSTDRVVETLVNLARMAPADIREKLSNAETDPFELEALKSGVCPWRGSVKDTVIDWLPGRMLPQPSEWFRSRNEPNHGNHRPVAVYYEHLSKAGGTSFCKLAQSNMPKKDVPNYYCMPSEPGMADARVGSWAPEKLVKYFESKAHRLVSNEWEPFNLDFLDLQPRSEADLTGGSGDSILLMFVTSIRDPINRLLSAYKFWGILNSSAKQKPSLEMYLQRRGRAAKRWYMMSEDFLGNVGRFNFATWKFSGGTLPVSEMQLDAEANLSKAKREPGSIDFSVAESEWRKPFETAIRTLSRFDLAIPMELMSEHHKPVTNLLGWTNFEKEHVVNIGKVQNNDASNDLAKGEYEALWDANALDMILFHWVSAVYLTRLNCEDILSSLEKVE